MKTLSDKAWIKEDEEGVLITYGHEDVKQFIKDLKKMLVEEDWWTDKIILESIDKLAGDKLIKEQKQ